MSDEDFYSTVEGIAHSYKQHQSNLKSVETERDENGLGRPMVHVSFEIGGSYSDHISHMARARLLSRLFRLDGAWVSRVTGDDTVIVVKKQ